MIPFFRKIRKKMADDNRPLKYMRYAIGEIVLVVIGILIALQINTWNEERKEQIQEKKLLANLKKDFDWNQEKLHYFVQLHEGSAKSFQTFLMLVGPEANHLEIDSLDHYIAGLMWNPVFKPKRDVSNSIFSSGKTDLFSNENILELLNSWTAILENYYYTIEEIKVENMMSVTPLLYQTYPAKNWAIKIGIKEISQKSQFTYPIDSLLRNREFENMLLIRTLNAIDISKLSKDLLKIQTELINEINLVLNSTAK